MRIAYFDCFSGISGDMILGSLIDAGLDIRVLEKELKKLGLKGWRIEKRKVRRGFLKGTKFDVIPGAKLARASFSPAEMAGIVEKSPLEEKVKAASKKIFRALVGAEAAVHGVRQGSVHFHELGSVDTIIDAVGASIALHSMKIERVFSSPLALGSGYTRCGHGLLPLPSPATLKLLKGRKVVFSSQPREMVTPTGAAVISSLSERSEEPPALEIEAVGYGAGSWQSEEVPNLLRVIVGRSGEDFTGDEVVVLETNIDDMSPQAYEPLFESLKEEGVLDAYLTPVQMKKSRPGCLLTVIFEPRLLNRVCARVFSETTTFGVRYRRVHRKKLKRESVVVSTRYGKVRVKKGMAGAAVLKAAPEYEDCHALAREKGVPFREIYEEALSLTRQHDYDKLHWKK